MLLCVTVHYSKSNSSDLRSIVVLMANIPLLGMGTWGMGGTFEADTTNDAASVSALRYGLNLGINLIDTADVYSSWVPGNTGGESEIIIGEWLKARRRRSDVLILTKGGMDMPGKGKGLSAAYRIEDEAELRWWLRKDARGAVIYDVHWLRARKAG